MVQALKPSWQGDDAMAEYEAELDIKPEVQQNQISSHTTQAQDVVGQKRQREDDSAPQDYNNSQPSRSSTTTFSSHLPAKPEDVRLPVLCCSLFCLSPRRFIMPARRVVSACNVFSPPHCLLVVSRRCMSLTPIVFPGLLVIVIVVVVLPVHHPM